MPSAIVPCVSWVPKGKAQQHPTKITLTADELKAMVAKHETELEDHKEELQQMLRKENMEDGDGGDGKDADSDDDPELAQYGLDDYDEEDGDGAGGKIASIPALEGAFMDMYIQSGADEYITLEKAKGSDDEDDEIKPDDSLLIVGKVADELSSLEVMLYNESEGSEYVHHDQMLDTFPLCLEWLDFPVHSQDSQKQLNCHANLVAAGGMEPCINIWNLDVVDSLEPVVQLGPTKRSKKKKKADVIGHNDAVLDLSWNRIARNLLASASADCTVILWDLRTRTCAHTLTAHSDKVQSVAWHPTEAASLLSGSMDKTVRLYNCHDPDKNQRVWKVSGEVETVLWNHFEPSQFLVSCDDGFVYCMDVRQSANKPLFQLSAHTQAVNAMSLSMQIEGCLATVSSDKELKVWDITGGRPTCVLSRKMKMGELLSAAFCHDAPFTLAIGGQKQGIRILNLGENPGVRGQFANRRPQVLGAPSEGTVEMPMAEAMDESAGAESSGASASAASFTPARSSAKSSMPRKKTTGRKKHRKR